MIVDCQDVVGDNAERVDGERRDRGEKSDGAEEEPDHVLLC